MFKTSLYSENSYNITIVIYFFEKIIWNTACPKKILYVSVPKRAALLIITAKCMA